MRAGSAVASALAVVLGTGAASGAEVTMESFEVPRGAHPHDVAPAADGGVWYTAQHQGALGLLDPATGEVEQIPLGDGSRPHGVVVGPDGDAWVTDGGLNAIVRVDAETREVEAFPLPDYRGYANLNTPAFDDKGTLWFTGQSGIYGRLDPKSGEMEVRRAPRGPGPYGITSTPEGEVYFASLAGDYVGHIDRDTGEVEVIDPPAGEPGTKVVRQGDEIVRVEGDRPKQGPRRVWSDSRGRIWVSQWHSGEVGVYEPADGSWREWRLPGANPQAYSVYVDENDVVWLTDFSANATVRFDPETETFEQFKSPRSNARIRQLHGRPGEVWGAESGTDHLVVLRTE